DVGSFATPRCAKVGIDWLTAVVHKHLTFGGANCGKDSTLELSVGRCTQGLRHSKPLTMSCGTKVIAVACMTTVVLHRVRANRNGECLQRFRLRFNCAFRAHHARDV